MFTKIALAPSVAFVVWFMLCVITVGEYGNITMGRHLINLL